MGFLKHFQNQLSSWWRDKNELQIDLDKRKWIIFMVYDIFHTEMLENSPEQWALEAAVSVTQFTAISSKPTSKGEKTSWSQCPAQGVESEGLEKKSCTDLTPPALLLIVLQNLFKQRHLNVLMDCKNCLICFLVSSQDYLTCSLKLSRGGNTHTVLYATSWFFPKFFSLSFKLINPSHEKSSPVGLGWFFSVRWSSTLLFWFFPYNTFSHVSICSVHSLLTWPRSLLRCSALGIGCCP